MKTLTIMLSFLLATSVNAPVKNAMTHAAPVHKKHKVDGAPVLFWTNNRSYGTIEIFVNDVYKGDITMSYDRTPECAANGCVTVIVSGDNNVWTAQTKDGKRKWASKGVRLANTVCNSECLL